MPHQTKHKCDDHTLLRDIGELAFEIKRSRQSAHLENGEFRGLLRSAQTLLRKAYELTQPKAGG